MGWTCSCPKREPHLSDVFTSVWEMAPKDGSAFKVQFVDGTISVVRRNVALRRWEVQFEQKWVPMNYERVVPGETVVCWSMVHELANTLDVAESHPGGVTGSDMAGRS